MRGPEPDPDDAPLRIEGRSGSSAIPILTAIGITLVVLFAIGLAQVFPAEPVAPATSPAAVGSVGAPTASASPSASPSLPPSAGADLPAARRLRPSELVAGVVDESLDGLAVYVDGFLRIECPPDGPAPCASPALSIDGVGLDVVPGDTVRDGIDAAERGLLALAVRDGRLVYLGSFVSDPDGPAAPSAAVAAVPPPAPRGVLLETGGWLVVDPACVTPGGATGTCPPTPPFLADDEPLGDGLLRSDAGLRVDVPPDAWGIDPDAGPVTPGPFLLAPPAAPDGRWRVIARYDPSRSVRVVVP